MKLWLRPAWLAGILLFTVSCQRCGRLPRLEPGWSVSGEFYSAASPRVADLNGDGTGDVVLGHGFDGVYVGTGTKPGFIGFVTATDGRNGKEIWRVDTHHDVVGSALFTDLTGNGKPDVVMGGRDGTLVAIEGATGRVLWRFIKVNGGREKGWYNFYSALAIGDRNGDGITDLLTTNGGDRTLAPFDPRPPGHLLVISGGDGSILARMQTPDGEETYTSPVIQRRPGQPDRVLFGTGGETRPGAFWAVPLDALLQQDATRVRRLTVPGKDKGVIAPPALADINLDGIEDIVVVTFDGRLLVLDGEDDTTIWSHQEENAESYGTPAVGFFTEDRVPDVFVSFSIGTFRKGYKGSRHLLLDGSGGKELFRHKGAGGFFPSPLAADLNGDGRDDVLFGDNEMYKSRRLSWLNTSTLEVGLLLESPAGGLATPWLGDLDGDGRLDLLMNTSGRKEGKLRWNLDLYGVTTPMKKAPAWGAYGGTGYDWRLQKPAGPPAPATAP